MLRQQQKGTDDTSSFLTHIQSQISDITIVQIGQVSSFQPTTDNAIARFDRTTGKLIQGSVVTISDVGIISGVLNPVSAQDAVTKTYSDSKYVLALNNTVSNTIHLMENNLHNPNSTTEYIERLVELNPNVTRTSSQYAHGAGTLGYDTYNSSVYDPVNDRIYFTPSVRANLLTDWQYVDCATSTIVSYTHGATVVSDQHRYGAYSSVQKKIYFGPFAVSATWHYIDVVTSAVVGYANGSGMGANECFGCCYSPTQDRVYLTPFNATATWYYIDCATNTVISYVGAVVNASAYLGDGVYSPTQNRIYFPPFGQSNNATWHFIDCSDGSVGTYAHGTGVATQEFSGGGCYAPTQNRIYLTPRSLPAVSDTTWYYINCDDGTVVGYVHGATIVDYAYFGMVFSPLENKIYLSPSGQCEESELHYIDCATSGPTVVTYPNSFIANNNTSSGSYSPTENMIYFCPIRTNDNWRRIELSNTVGNVSKTFCASALMNN